MKRTAIAGLWMGTLCACAHAPATVQVPLWGDGVENLTDSPWHVSQQMAGPVWIEIEAGQPTLHLGMGNPITALTWQDATLPAPMQDGENYCIRMRAKRVRGSDFFVGMTFPIGDIFATAIIGGWGGGTCGLSNVNGLDASQNQTTTIVRIESDRWYQIEIRVELNSVSCLFDGELLWQQDRAGVQFSTRREMTPHQPWSLASFMTEAAIQNVEVIALD